MKNFKKCWNATRRVWEDCDEVYTPTPSAARGKSTNRDCLEGCAVSEAQLRDVIQRINGVVSAGITVPLVQGPNIDGAIFSLTTQFMIIGLSFSGTELVIDGTPTGYSLANVTNTGLTVTSGILYYNLEFSSTSECPAFFWEFFLTVTPVGPDFFVQPRVRLCWGDFGQVVKTSCFGCYGPKKKCSTNLPALNLPTYTLPAAIAPGVTFIDLPSALVAGGDLCCEIIGISVSSSTPSPLLEFQFLGSQLLKAINYSGTTIEGTIELLIWTSCGLIATPFELVIPPACSGSITVTPEPQYLGLLIDPLTTSAAIRKNELYTINDITGCCGDPVLSTTDPAVLGINDVGTNWVFDFELSSLTSNAHFFELLITTPGCGTERKIMNFNKTTQACLVAAPMDQLDTSLNNATGTALFQIPAGGAITVTLTSDLIQINDPCCGTTVALDSSLPNPLRLTQIYSSPLTDGLAGSSITLTAKAGEVPAGIKNEQLQIVGNCGAFLIDVDYEIV